MRKIQLNKKLLFLALIVGVGISFSFKSNFFEVAKQIEIYTSLFKELNMYYVEEINPAELTNKAIKNTLKELDPYTNYYNEQDVEEAKIRREGEYAGIGVSVYYGKQGIVIDEIYEGFSADKNKLKAGDLITEINGQSLKGLERDQLSELLKGAPNSTVDIQVLRQNKTLTFKVKREKVIYNPVPFFDMIDEQTGYIVLTRFNLKASSEVKKAFRALEKRGMKQLIFDLRGNPGGSLGEAINISNFFLPKNSPIVSTRGKVKKLSVNYKGNKEPLSLDMPLVVLIDRRSASASEIVSGALQDYDRAVIIGERSFGKGLVQRYRELDYGTQLKVTISKYYTPSGRCIQELDYANRLKDGTVPKFSEGVVNAFKTKNGRTVYDGGGVTPDVKIGYPVPSKTLNSLLSSRAIFNFATSYFYNNPSIAKAEDYSFKNPDFKLFINYLRTVDTTFISSEEKKFKEAFKEVKQQEYILKDYKSLMKAIKENKLQEVSKNKEYIMSLLQDELVLRYYYKKGIYQNRLNNDKVIVKALDLINDKQEYDGILSGA